MASGAGPVRVEGLDDFVRAVARVDKQAVRAVRKELRVGIGGAVVRDVKARIDSEGLVATGKLRSTIRPAVKGSTLVVRSSPPLRPGPRSQQGYASIYEFGGRAAGSSVGVRAFMQPTFEEWQDGKAEEAFGAFLDWVEREYAS